MSHQTIVANETEVGVVITGRVLDEQTASGVINEVTELVHSGVKVVIFDCSPLEFITSYGLSVFLRARKMLRESHGETGAPLTSDTPRVRLSNVSPMVREVLETAQLMSVLPVFDSVDEAAALSQS